MKIRTAGIQGVWLAALMIGPAGVWAQQEPAPAPPPAIPPSSIVVRFTQGVRLFTQGEFGEAQRIFSEIIAADPQNVAARYYLGLSYLNLGLGQTGAEARQSYEQAREQLDQVVRATAEGRGLRPVNALLELGIAQLASREMRMMDEEARRQNLDAAERAVQDLQEYQKTPEGGEDPYGPFYLGIAHYRRAIILGGENRFESQRSLQNAYESFRESIALARRLQGFDVGALEARVNFYMGLIEVARGNRTSAKRLFDEVVAAFPADTTDEFALYARDFRARLAESEEREPSAIPVGPLELQVRATMGNAYDSNVILLGQDTALPRRISQKDDYEFLLRGEFDLTRTFTSAELPLGESLTLGFGGTAAQSWHPSIKEFDLGQYGGRGYVNWEVIKDLLLGVQYDYNYFLLGRSPYISSNRVTPVISKLWRGAADVDDPEGAICARTDLYYSYDRRNYLDELFDDRFDRDGDYHALGVNQSFNLVRARKLWPQCYPAPAEGVRPSDDGDRWLSVLVGYGYRSEATRGTEFDLSGHTVAGGVEVPLPWRLDFSFRSELTWDDYKQPSLLDYRRNAREDFIQRYLFFLTRTLVRRGENATMRTLEVKARAGVDVTFQDSNVWDRLSQDVYSYNRAVYRFDVQFSF